MALEDVIRQVPGTEEFLYGEITVTLKTISLDSFPNLESNSIRVPDILPATEIIDLRERRFDIDRDDITVIDESELKPELSTEALWEYGYLQLRDLFSAIQLASNTPVETLIPRLESLFSTRKGIQNELFRNIGIGKTPKPLDVSIREHLSAISKSEGETSNRKYRLAKIIVENLLRHSTLDQAIIQTSIDPQNENSPAQNLNDILNLVTPNDKSITSALILDINEESDIVNLHINPSSKNMFKMVGKLRNEVRQVRNNGEIYQYKPLFGVSWLVNPQLISLGKYLGFPQSTDIKYEFFNPDAILENSFNYRTLTNNDKLAKEILYAAFVGRFLSQGNLVRFLSEGLLPDVGTIYIPGKAFWNNK
jgi:hypothetical protein